MKITMMMSSRSCQLGSMTASWSYKVGVWSESHGCPSFKLLVVFYKNLASRFTFFSPELSTALHYGKCRMDKGSEPCVNSLQSFKKKSVQQLYGIIITNHWSAP